MILAVGIVLRQRDAAGGPQHRHQEGRDDILLDHAFLQQSGNTP
jgi:hypothetical protein